MRVGMEQEQPVPDDDSPNSIWNSKQELQE
jgi:hypothetical protein